MMNGCSWIVTITLLHLIFGIRQCQSSSLKADGFSERKSDLEKKQQNGRSSSKGGQGPSSFKINTDLAPDGRQSFDPWGGKKRSENDKNVYPKNYSANKDSITQDISTRRQKRKLVSSYQKLIPPYNFQSDDSGCEPSDLAFCGLKLYQTGSKTDNPNFTSDEVAPELIYNSLKNNVQYGMKKNFNAWGGKRYMDVSYPKDDANDRWDGLKPKDGKIATEFINRINNSILFISRDSFKPHISGNTNLPENNDKEHLVDKSDEENFSLNNVLNNSPVNYQEPLRKNSNYVINERNFEGIKATGNDQMGRFFSDWINDKINKRDSIYSSVDNSNIQTKKNGRWSKKKFPKSWNEGTYHNNRNQAGWKNNNFDELIHTMRMLNPWNGEYDKNNSRKLILDSPVRNLRNFEPWAGKRSSIGPLPERFSIRYPSYSIFDSSERITPYKELSRNIRNFNAWGGKRNYYPWGGKRSREYLKNISKFNPITSKASDILNSGPESKWTFVRGDINALVNKTRKLSSWGGKRKLNENLKI